MIPSGKLTIAMVLLRRKRASTPMRSPGEALADSAVSRTLVRRLAVEHLAICLSPSSAARLAVLPTRSPEAVDNDL